MIEKEITITVDIDTSPEVVFKTISDPKELIKWFPDEAILELRVGGKYRVSFLKDSKNRRMKLDRDFINEGKVLEIIQNKKLVHTWQWKAFSGFPETVVLWELEQINQSKTRLTLAHTGFTGKEEGPASVQEHKKGWSFFLNELVSWELAQINQNKTRLTLAHTGFTGKEEGPASVQEHKKGWSFFLNELVSYCKEKN